MDISNLTQNLIKGLAQKNNTELAALSRALDIALGKVTTATVTEITPVTAQERQELLNKTAQALQQLGKLTQTSPAVKEEASRLLEQQALIKSPDLKWVNLLVNNRQLLTYSDKPLVAGQTVPVQLATAQKLVLLDAPDTEGTARAATADRSQMASSTYAAKVAVLPNTIAAIEPRASTTTNPPNPEEFTENSLAIKNSSAASATVKIQMARVTETAPMSADERQDLLKKTSEELQKLNKMAGASQQPIPGLKEAIASLQQQQTLIKSAATRWVHLTAGNQSLLTYSDKPLAAGQALPIQLLTPQKIALLDLPEAHGHADTLENKLKGLAEAINTGQKIPLPTYFSKFSLPAISSGQNANPATAPEEDSGQIIPREIQANLSATAPPRIQLATVTETLPIAPQERQELLNKTNEELLKLNKMAGSTTQVIPGLKEAITSLLQQQTLIKSPDSKWIHLSAENQSLLTYSNKPLVAGQTIPVQIVTPQKIVLLDLPEAAKPTAETITKEPTANDSRLKALSENLQVALAAQRNAIPTYFSKFSLPANATGHTPSEPEAAPDPKQHVAINHPANPGATAARIQQASVTETAPISASERQELLKNISQELAQLDKLAGNKGQVSPELKQAIANLSQQQALIKSPDTKWIHLRLNDQTLLTYSDKPVSLKQSLAVQIITPQKIILLEHATPDSEPTRKGAGENINNPQKNSLPTYFAKLGSATALTPADIPEPSIAKSDLAGKPAATLPATAAVSHTASAPTQIATVIKTMAVSQQQRQELLIKVAAELVQLNKLASSAAHTIPSAKEVISALLEQQDLIKSPNLKWVELSLNNKPLTTYSEKALQQGQAISVQLTSAQKIVLLNNGDANSDLETAETSADSKNAIQTGAGEKAPLQAPADKTSTPPDDRTSSASPWQTVASATEQLLAPKTLEQALKRAAEQIRSQLQLSQANAAKTPSLTTANEAIDTAIKSTLMETPHSPAANKSLSPAAASATVAATTASVEAEALLEEIAQRLNGSNKPMSVELAAKILERLIHPNAAATSAANQQTTDGPPLNPAGTKNASTEASTTRTAQAQAQAQDIKVLLQQLLNSPASAIPHKEAREQLIKLMQLPAENFEKMDISKLTQHLTKGLEQNNRAELAPLSRALNVTLGKPVVATVTETAPVTAQERKELLTKTTEALTQLNKLASNPAQATAAVKAEILRLSEQQTLIKSPELKWVNLSVNNNTLLTYTDKLLSAGQAVPVQLVNQQKLVLLDFVADNNAKNIQNAASTTANALGKTIAAPLANELLSNLTGGAAKSSVNELLKNQAAGSASAAGITGYKLNTPEIKQIVADRLRQLLPYKDTPSALFSAVNQLQQIPAAVKQSLLSPNLEQALKSVAEKIRSPLQISQPKVLETIIKNSGIFFENQLNSNQVSKGSSLDNLFSQDLKGSLLNLLSKVNQELNGSNKPLTTEQTTRLLQQLSSYTPSPASYAAPGGAGDLARNTLAPDIGMLVQQLMTKSVKHMSDKELRTQLLVLMQQHSLHSIAKIQMQQLASLNHELDSKDTAQTNASWQVEIPIKHHNDVQQLHIRIDREWVEEKNASEQSKPGNNKIKQWSVTLRFDLPTLGEFCSQLSIIDTSVSATLWASQEKTFGQVKKQMDDLRNNLEKEGIQVKQLQCMKGMPPQKPMALSYSLIDIST